jgi:hypothetical protein
MASANHLTDEPWHLLRPVRRRGALSAIARCDFSMARSTWVGGLRDGTITDLQVPKIHSLLWDGILSISSVRRTSASGKRVSKIKQTELPVTVMMTRLTSASAERVRWELKRGNWTRLFPKDADGQSFSTSGRRYRAWAALLRILDLFDRTTQSCARTSLEVESKNPPFLVGFQPEGLATATQLVRPWCASPSTQRTARCFLGRHLFVGGAPEFRDLVNLQHLQGCPAYHAWERSVSLGCAFGSSC